MADHQAATWVRDIGWPQLGSAAIYDLAHRLHTGVPHHPIHPPFAYTLTKKHGDVRYPDGVSSAGGQFMLADHGGTHIDALNHVSRDGRIYQGESVMDGQDYATGIPAGSIDDAPPLMTQGHLVDLSAVLGRAMHPGEPIVAQHLDDWFREREEPTAGSAVLFRTGWDEFWPNPERFIGVNSGLPGVSLDAARWLTDRGVAYAGSDTVAFEVMPSPSLDVHCHLLIEHGVYILESLNLSALAADSAWDFLMIAIPLPLQGATGSPVRPLAVVAAESRHHDLES